MDKISFWNNLEKPIIGLAPMDGITDATYRYVIDKHSKPGLLFTEFLNVEGITRGAVRLMSILIRHKTNTPIVAQLLGADPYAFYKTFFIVAEMGFDGVDINMGCPDRAVVKAKAGASLISDHNLASSIVQETRRAAYDWANGKKISEIEISREIFDYIRNYKELNKIKIVPRLLPISVKTRLAPTIDDSFLWFNTLIKSNPSAITIHGRTLAQKYSGYTDWNMIKLFSKIIKNNNIVCLGNGDIKNLEQALRFCDKYEVDGVLVGRAALGNPWFFSNKIPEKAERFQLIKEHAQKYMEMTPDLNFLNLRKHFGWYCKGLPNASSLRSRLTKISSIGEIDKILDSETHN